MPSPLFNGLGEQVHNIFKNEVAAVFKPVNGNVRPIEIIFNDRHKDIDIDGQEYGAAKPVAWFLTGVICPVFGDVLEINGIKYLVREVKNDGLELTELILSECM